MIEQLRIKTSAMLRQYGRNCLDERIVFGRGERHHFVMPGIDTREHGFIFLRRKRVLQGRRLLRGEIDCQLDFG